MNRQLFCGGRGARAGIVVLVGVLALTLLVERFVAPSRVESQSSAYPPSPVLAGVTWDSASLFQAAEGSDLWPTTWGDDGSLYTAWGDGGGFGGSNTVGRVALGFGRITGGPTGLVECDNLQDVWGGACAQNQAQFGGKVEGLISVGGVIYGWWNSQDRDPAPPSHRLIWSADHAASWTQSSWSFDSGVFTPITFLQFGPANAGPRDNYIYMYGKAWGGSPGYQAHPGMYLVRVDASQLTDQTVYDYFAGLDGTGQPTWSRAEGARQPVVDLGTATVTYNAGLKRYLLTTSTRGGSAGLAILDAPEPWGPWTSVASYDTWMNAAPDAEFLGATFINKWTSSDGLDTWMIFSDYGGARPDRFHDHFNLIHASFILRTAASRQLDTTPQADQDV